MKGYLHSVLMYVLKSLEFDYSKSTLCVIQFQTFVVQSVFPLVQFQTFVVKSILWAIQFQTFVVQSVFSFVQFQTFVVKSTFAIVQSTLCALQFQTFHFEYFCLNSRFKLLNL